MDFGRARFADLLPEILPLWDAHWREVGQDRDRVLLAPDFDKYAALDLRGNLEITAARRDGVLVGYLFSLVDTHLHYRDTLCSGQDLRYLRPECRGGRAALRMAEAHEAQLKARGVVRMVAGVKHASDRDGLLFERLGWRPFETLYGKVL